MAHEHFDSIDGLVTRLWRDTPKNPLGTDPNPNEFEWIDWGDEDGGRIMPCLNSAFISPYLYRGQTERHSPCLPKLHRCFGEVKRPQELSQKGRDAYILAQVRVAEFFAVLDQHPSVRFAREIGLHLNRTALAQHYELPTDLLDLTADPEVAAFFGACRRDSEEDWHPVSTGEGVVYRFDLTALPLDFFRSSVEMIGLLTLPRPGEQKAWTIRLRLGLDFEKFPLDVFTFRHGSEAGCTLLDRFDRGRALFPRDPLAEAAAAIQRSNTVPISVLRRVLIDHECPADMLDERVDSCSQRFRDEFSIDAIDREPLVLDAEQQAEAAAEVARKRAGFLRNVGVRRIRATRNE